MPGMLARFSDAEELADLLAWNQQEALVRQPPTLFEHRLHLRQPQRTGV